MIIRIGTQRIFEKHLERLFLLASGKKWHKTTSQYAREKRKHVTQNSHIRLPWIVRLVADIVDVNVDSVDISSTRGIRTFGVPRFRFLRSPARIRQSVQVGVGSFGAMLVTAWYSIPDFEGFVAFSLLADDDMDARRRRPNSWREQLENGKDPDARIRRDVSALRVLH